MSAEPGMKDEGLGIQCQLCPAEAIYVFVQDDVGTLMCEDCHREWCWATGQEHLLGITQ